MKARELVQLFDEEQHADSMVPASLKSDTRPFVERFCEKHGLTKEELDAAFAAYFGSVFR